MQLMLDLTQRDPSNANWQRELSVSHNSCGQCACSPGSIIEALRNTAMQLSGSRRDPNNANWQRDLAVSHNCVGSVLEPRAIRGPPRVRGRQAAYADLTQRPEQCELAAGLVRCLAQLCGQCACSPGSIVRDPPRVRGRQQLMRDLTQRDPNNANWQRDLAVSHNCVGSVLAAQGQLSEALQEYLADLAISEQLVAHDPSNAQWQEDLNVTRTLIDKLQIEINDHSGRPNKGT